jgi:hypothetical protein
MAKSTSVAVRSYRIYFRDTTDAFTRTHEVDLASDGEARELAAQLLDEQGACPTAEVWDRARLVCILRRNAAEPK